MLAAAFVACSPSIEGACRHGSEAVRRRQVQLAGLVERSPLRHLTGSALAKRLDLRRGRKHHSLDAAREAIVVAIHGGTGEHRADVARPLEIRHLAG